MSSRIIKATVRIGNDRRHGQGVLIPGGFILTAAHCIRWNDEDRPMPSVVSAVALGEVFIEEVTTASGIRLFVTPVAVDLFSDIAVLGGLDAQEFDEQATAFEEWCESTEPVRVEMTTIRPVTKAEIARRVRTGKGRLGNSIAVRIRTHRGAWIKGRATRRSRESSAWLPLETSDQIESGTSGGPVVNSQGRLIGIVSQDHQCSGRLPSLASVDSGQSEAGTGETEGREINPWRSTVRNTAIRKPAS